uniref:Uncharacterized protein n=1 Tax=Lepeophtheirus salmonis TaxID=72036 RepID=A0A0K2VKE3_LEPSM
MSKSKSMKEFMGYGSFSHAVIILSQVDYIAPSKGIKSQIRIAATSSCEYIDPMSLS